MNAKIYFKQPDLIHIESNGFAMLPKDGLYTSPLSLLNGDYTAIFVKDENIDGHNTSVVKIIPLNEKGNVVLSTLWIDQSLNVIRKVESTTKTNGTFTLALAYGNNKYPLPDKMEFVFNAERMKFPQMQMDEENIDKKKEKRNLSGKVVITYSNYSVNKGIPDSVFKKPNKGLSE
jgi:outer membrane lipoprotein-sorting protein